MAVVVVINPLVLYLYIYSSFNTTNENDPLRIIDRGSEMKRARVALQVINIIGCASGLRDKFSHVHLHM